MKQTIGNMTLDSENKIVSVTGIHGYGTICKRHLGKKPDKTMCHGCTNDFYNGHNDLGVKECWLFKKAVVVDKVGHTSIHITGGVDGVMRNTLSCWHGVRK